MNAPRDSSFDDYMTESMKDPAEAAAYIEAVMELDDPTALLVALRHVAKAHGMAEVARRANVGEKTLFKSLSENGNPTIAMCCIWPTTTGMDASSRRQQPRPH